MYKNQLAALVLCLLLGIVIYFFAERNNKSINKKDITTQQNKQKNVSGDENTLVKQAKERLNEPAKKEIDLLEKALAAVQTKSSKIIGTERIADFWQHETNFELSAIYLEKIANLEPDSAQYWSKAGTRFLAAADMETDTSQKSRLFEKAIFTMQKASTLQPDDNNLKADLANAITVGTAQPMQGVQTLLSIVDKEPKHLSANYYLGQLAIRSNQHDKAVARFKNIVEWYPAFPDAYLGLGESYYQSGQTNEAIKTLEQYKAMIKDPLVIQQIEAFIKQIKTNVD